ncbi:hypothetical protein L873DRAFT_1849302 [Choiromyces venosus 120613-1]|uniref:Uncharacterized protein n=1 Tax=Choiromyces venosus 120613-1 TaxID=1336337 RepID=A0A3N4IUG7_9PEZI|nr:hypothetical protein L873DRAFT_1849302 [Choiromyces venosus 120613-1]
MQGKNVNIQEQQTMILAMRRNKDAIVHDAFKILPPEVDKKMQQEEISDSNQIRSSISHRQTLSDSCNTIMKVDISDEIVGSESFFENLSSDSGNSNFEERHVFDTEDCTCNKS